MIEITQGFLTLHIVNGENEDVPFYIKGSSIVAMTVNRWDTPVSGARGLDQRIEFRYGTMVWFDSLNANSQGVKEPIEEILAAIAESYKQARMR